MDAGKEEAIAIRYTASPASLYTRSKDEKNLRNEIGNVLVEWHRTHDAVIES